MKRALALILVVALLAGIDVAVAADGSRVCGFRFTPALLEDAARVDPDVHHHACERVRDYDRASQWCRRAVQYAERGFPVAVHPTEAESRHELYLMCDDIGATVEELKRLARKGVTAVSINENPTVLGQPSIHNYILHDGRPTWP